MNRDTVHQKIERVSRHFDFHFTPHALRRAFVTINVNQGKPLVHLQIACGHSDITTARNYCMTSQNEVIEAMKNW
jgi:site-specific recombinase XerD